MIDLNNLGDRGITINGADPQTLLGFGYGGSPGDFNGDGIADLIIPAPGAAGANATVFVVFGGDTLLDGVDLGNLDADEGLVLTGEANSFAGRAISSAGDVNGDGIDDILIGAEFTGAANPGAAYVVFGSQTLGTTDIDLTALGDAGFTIAGNGYEGVGRNAQGVGDVNGDGFDDIAVSAIGNGENGAASGAIYVIFGSDQGFPDTIDTNALGPRGFKILGANTGDAIGARIAAGDFNEDGKSDLVFTNGANVGFLFSDDTTPTGSIVLGTDPDTFIFATGVTGTQRIAAGDFDGDGKDDLAVGLPNDAQGGTGRGSISVLSTVSLDSVLPNFTTLAAHLASTPTALFDRTKLIGTDDNQQLGGSLANVGDVGGEGGDFVAFDPYGSGFAGQGSDLYLLGSILAGRDRFDVAIGPEAQDDGVTTVTGVTGATAASAFAIGDVNGDGLFDFMIGTPNAGANDQGRVDIVIGSFFSLPTDGSDNFRGGVRAETLNGGAGNDTLNGGGGNDSINGGTGLDLLIAGEGDDTILGDDDNDLLYGGQGRDVLFGGAGNDVIRGNAGDDNVEGLAGNDEIRGQVGDDSVDGGLGNNNLFGGGGNDLVNSGPGVDTLNGNSGADTVDGGAGNDLLRGQGGNDSITGGDGNDTIRGMSGFDQMFGGAGDDVLTGGVGNDTATGGDGADTFEYAQGQGSNVITDYDLDQDMISIVGTNSIDDLSFFTVNNDALIRLAAEGAFATLEITVQNTNRDLLATQIQIGYNMGGSPPPAPPDEGWLLLP